MIKFDSSKMSELTNDNIANIKYENVVCYVFIGGNPGGTEGDVYIFDLFEEELQVHRGNVYHGNLSVERVAELLPKADVFWKSFSMRGVCDVQWTLEPYVMGHYVFIKRYMKGAIAKHWKNIEEKSHIKRLLKSVHMLCNDFEEQLLHKPLISEESIPEELRIKKGLSETNAMELDEKKVHNMMYRILELASTNRNKVYSRKECAKKTSDIIWKELDK